MQFKINQGELRRLLTSPAGPVVRHASDIGNEVAQTAKTLAPVDEGQLRASIDWTLIVSGNKLIVRVGSPLPQARYVNEGTGIYGPKRAPITPKHGKFLVFEPSRSMGPLPKGGKHPPKGKRGKLVFARQVRGMPKNPFFVEALRRVVGNVQER